MRPRQSERRPGLIRWLTRSGAEGAPGKSGGKAASGKAKEYDGQRGALDWRIALARLGPVRHRWDLAILCNLEESAGRRPADLLLTINSQTGSGRQLSPQVLSVRLRELERDGYVRHQDLAVMPLHRVYYLQRRGQTLIRDLSRIISPRSPTPRPAGAAGDLR